MPIDLQAAVIANVRLSDDYNVLELDAPAIGARARPGQFVMLKADAICESLLRRPFSVFEVLRDGDRIVGISILNKRAGPNTRALYAIEPGERVACLGPLGRPFREAGEREAWMVAGGVGLAPFATLAESLARRGVPSTLFYGARRRRELFYLDRFERLGVRLVLATEDGSAGAHGRVTDPLERALASLQAPAQVMVYACGPEPMLKAVATLAARYAQPCEVSVERVMGCGLGGCYSCVIPLHARDSGDTARTHFVRSCLSGPVFDAADIAWESA